MSSRNSDFYGLDDGIAELERGGQLSEQFGNLLNRIEKAATEASGKDKDYLEGRLETLEGIHYFNAASYSDGEPFQFLGVVSDRRNDLQEIGATGCLAALDRLSARHTEWMSLHHKSDQVNNSGETIQYYEESEESAAYLEEHKEEIEKSVSLIEEHDELQILLNEAARKVLAEVGGDLSR